VNKINPNRYPIYKFFGSFYSKVILVPVWISLKVFCICSIYLCHILIPFVYYSTTLSSNLKTNVLRQITGRRGGGLEAQLWVQSTIISEIIPRSHNKYPEYCLLSGERNRVRKDTQPCVRLGTPSDSRDSPAAGSVRAFLGQWFKTNFLYYFHHSCSR